jgi:hypothetical protein
MDKVKVIIASALVSVGLLAAPLALVTDAGAVNPKTAICDGVSGAGSPQTCGSTGTLNTLIRNVINILLFVVGVISVIMIIIGGIRYITSGGDQSAITSAKNTILYSIVGLVVALLAYAIVNFVIGQF